MHKVFVLVDLRVFEEISSVRKKVQISYKGVYFENGHEPIYLLQVYRDREVSELLIV